MAEANSDALAKGTRFARYEIVRCIGKGGMGAVYEARHLDLQKRVAIKTLHNALASSHEMFERFVREGRAASRIHHPHVVSVSDVGSYEGTPYLVMEYLDGEDLGGLLDRTPIVPLETLAGIMLPVLAALATAHEEGIVHRDLKPENIFLSRTRNGGMIPKVLDFGISKLGGAETARITSSAAVLGTPCYMAPEQAQNSSRTDLRSDLYSLGVILYEATCGVRPITGENVYEVLIAISKGEFAPPRSIVPALPVAFEAVILRAMSHRADDRYASAYELARELLPFATAGDRARWEGVFAADRKHSVRPAYSPLETQVTYDAIAIADTMGRGAEVPAAPETPPEVGVSTLAATTGSTRKGQRGAPRIAFVGAVALSAAVGVAVLARIAMRSSSRPIAVQPAPVVQFAPRDRVPSRVETPSTPLHVSAVDSPTPPPVRSTLLERASDAGTVGEHLPRHAVTSRAARPAAAGTRSPPATGTPAAPSAPPTPQRTGHAASGGYLVD